MITISLCMIVKNEERVLARCLDSLSGLMDEIIIVDTGSTDATKEIAGRYTKHIYDYVWKDDFADARNFSFQKATKDYIYVADADEVLNEENREAFRQLKEALLPEIDIVQMLYCNQLQYNTTYNFDKEYRPKLYKRVRNFYWQDAIHESVVLEPVIYDSNVEVFHMPENNHAPRDFKAFQKLIERGGRLSKKLHNMYARELFIAGEDEDFIEAKPIFETTVLEANRSLGEIKEAALVLSHIYRIQENTSDFFKYVLKDIVTEPSSEACMELGEYFFAREDYEEACNWYQNAMEGTKPVLNVHYGTDYPKKRLMDCYQALLEKAEKNQDFMLEEQYREALKQMSEE